MKTPQEQAIEIADQIAEVSKACMAGNLKKAQSHIEGVGVLLSDHIESLTGIPAPQQSNPEQDAQEFPTH